MTKLEQLAEIEGVSIEEMLEQAVFDSICPGICTNPNCDYTITVEPDQRNGYCEICNTQTVQSVLVIAHLI